MTQKIVLVTGATSGIGRHAALHLAARGCRVFATGRNTSALTSLTAEAKAAGLPLETFALDVTSTESIARAKSFVDKATDGAGLDVLINNAGYGTSGPTELCTDKDMRAQYDVNVFGLMAMTRAFLPAMRERRTGRVINVSSVGGRMTLPVMGVYNSTKYAVESLTNALRMELQPFGIKFVLIEPGPIKTGFTQRAAHEVEKYCVPDSPYAGVTDHADELFAQADKMSAEPIVVSRAIARAVFSRRPRARYVAPFSSRIMLALVGIMPTSCSDWIMRQVAGLTRKKLGLDAKPQARLGSA